MIFHKLIIFQIISNSVAVLVTSAILEDYFSTGIQTTIIILTSMFTTIKVIKMKLALQFLLNLVLFENAQFTEQRLVQIYSLMSWAYLSYQLINQNIYFQIPTLLHILISIIAKTILSLRGYDPSFYLSIAIITTYAISAIIYGYSLGINSIQQEMDLECHTPKTSQFQQILTNRTQPSKILETLVLDYLPVGIVVLTGNHDFYYMNKKSVKLLEASSGSQINDENVVEVIKILLRKCINNKIASNQCSQRPSLSRINHLLSRFSRKHVTSLPYLEDNFSLQMDPINSILQQYNDLIPNSQQQIDVNIKFNQNKYQIKYQQSGKKKCFRFHFHKHHNQIYITMLDETSKVIKIDQRNKFIFQHQLLNSFSHELKTPLNCTQQLLEVLMSKVDPQFINSIIKPIKWQTDLLLCQINDILDYASFEIDDFSQNLMQFNLEDLLEECREIYILACSEKNIKIIQTSNSKHLINNDEKRLKQVIINLLNNSIKFTAQSGKITLSVEEEGPNLFHVSVIDSGLGFTNEQLQKIQNSLDSDNHMADFSQFHIGLGLKVANKLVMGFSTLKKGLKITSILNKGTIISFYVEDFVEESSQMSDSVVQSMLLSRQLSQLTTREFKFIKSLVCKCNKILIVDDIPFNHHALKLILNEFNQQADSAYDGVQAVNCVENRQIQNKCHPYYQLVFMDIEMPQLNGFEASIKIKQLLGENKENTAIIMCSAYDNQECIKISKRCQMIDVLPKPINRFNLQMILEKYLK